MEEKLELRKYAGGKRKLKDFLFVLILLEEPCLSAETRGGEHPAVDCIRPAKSCGLALVQDRTDTDASLSTACSFSTVFYGPQTML